MKELKKGDRVAIYSGGWKKRTGEVMEYRGSDILALVEDKTRYLILAHPKQCRRLKKKEHKYYYINLSKVGAFYEWETYSNQLDAMLARSKGYVETLKVKVVGRIK